MSKSGGKWRKKQISHPDSLFWSPCLVSLETLLTTVAVLPSLARNQTHLHFLGNKAEAQSLKHSLPSYLFLMHVSNIWWWNRELVYIKAVLQPRQCILLKGHMSAVTQRPTQLIKKSNEHNTNNPLFLCRHVIKRDDIPLRKYFQVPRKILPLNYAYVNIYLYQNSSCFAPLMLSFTILALIQFSFLLLPTFTYRKFICL